MGGSQVYRVFRFSCILLTVYLELIKSIYTFVYVKYIQRFTLEGVKCKAQKNKRQFFFHSSIMYYNSTKFITKVFHATDQLAMELLVGLWKCCNKYSVQTNHKQVQITISSL